MAIELRTNKASALTYNEMDRNFSSFFYSASVDTTTNRLYLWYTGSANLNTSPNDNYGPARSVEVELQPTTGNNPTLVVAGNPRNIQFRHAIDPRLDADTGFIYTTSQQLGIGAATPNATAKIHAVGTGIIPATLRLETTSTGNANRRSVIDFYQGSTFMGTIGRHDPFDNNMYIKSWAPTGKFAVDSDPGHIRFVVGNNVTIGAFTQAGFGIGTFQPQHTFHAEGNGYFAGNIGIGAYPGAAKVTVYQIDQLQSSAGDFKHLVSLSNIPISSVNALHTSIVRTSAGADWTTSGMRIQQQVDSEYMGYLQFSGDNNNYGITMGTGTSGPGGSILAPIEAFRITQPSQTAAGKVGINTKTPNAQLDVNGDTIVTGSFTVRGNTLTTGNATINGTATVDLSLTTGTTATIGTDLTVTGTATIGNIPAGTAGAGTKILTANNAGQIQYITGTFPLGGIVMWAGSPTAPPTGWTLCDGRAPVGGITIPDLRERFIVGAGGDNEGVVSKNYATAQFDLQPNTFLGNGTVSLPLNSLANGVYNVVTTGIYHHIPGTMIVQGAIGGAEYGERFFVYQKTGSNPYYLIYSTMVSNYILVRGTFPGAGSIPNFQQATSTTSTTPGHYFNQRTATTRGVADYSREVNGAWINGKRPDHVGFYYYDTLGYNIGDRGGNNEVTLEVAQIPPHTHRIVHRRDQSGPGASGGTDLYDTPNNDEAGFGTSLFITADNTGGYLPHENRPPYYALAFIIYTGV